MKRKVVMSGNKTLTVSLPIDWAKKNGIKAGDDIDLIEKGQEIIINASESQKNIGEYLVKIPEEIEKDLSKYVNKLIISPYTRGYDQIKVLFKNKNILSSVSKTIDRFMLGSEIVEQGENYCIIKILVKGQNEEITQVINRLYLLLITMLKDLQDILSKEKWDDLESIEQMDHSINKLHFFCRRMLNTKGYKDDSKTRTLYRLSCLIEEMSDYIVDIARITRNYKKIDKNLINLLGDMEKLVSGHYSLYSKYDHQKVVDLKLKRNEIRDKIHNQISKPSKEDVIIIHLLLGILDKIMHMNEDFIDNGY